MRVTDILLVFVGLAIVGQLWTWGVILHPAAAVILAVVVVLAVGGQRT